MAAAGPAQQVLLWGRWQRGRPAFPLDCSSSDSSPGCTVDTDVAGDGQETEQDNGPRLAQTEWKMYRAVSGRDPQLTELKFRDVTMSYSIVLQITMGNFLFISVSDPCLKELIAGCVTGVQACKSDSSNLMKLRTQCHINPKMCKMTFLKFQNAVILAQQNCAMIFVRLFVKIEMIWKPS